MYFRRGSSNLVHSGVLSVHVSKMHYLIQSFFLGNFFCVETKINCSHSPQKMP